MDHAGAAVGPLLATVFLYFSPDNYRLLFGLTIIPGLLAVATLLRVPGNGPHDALGTSGTCGTCGTRQGH